MRDVYVAPMSDVAILGRGVADRRIARIGDALQYTQYLLTLVSCELCVVSENVARCSLDHMVSALTDRGRTSRVACVSLCLKTVRVWKPCTLSSTATPYSSLGPETGMRKRPLPLWVGTRVSEPHPA